jgi:hypothetical protein
MKNTLKGNLRRIALAIGVVGVFAGCNVPPKFLVGESFIGTKYAKYMIQRMGAAGSGDQAVNLYAYYVRICDIDEKTGASKGCVDSQVVDNITSW